MIHIDLSHAPLVVIDYLQNGANTDIGETTRAHDRLIDLDFEHALVTDLCEERLDCSMSEVLGKVDQCLQNRRRALSWNCRALGVLVSDDRHHQVGDVLLEVIPSDVPAQVFSDPWEMIRWSSSFFDEDEGEELEPTPDSRDDPHLAPAATVSRVRDESFGVPQTPNSESRPRERLWSPYDTSSVPESD